MAAIQSISISFQTIVENNEKGQTITTIQSDGQQYGSIQQLAQTVAVPSVLLNNFAQLAKTMDTECNCVNCSQAQSPDLTVEIQVEVTPPDLAHVAEYNKKFWIAVALFFTLIPIGFAIYYYYQASKAGEYSIQGKSYYTPTGGETTFKEKFQVDNSTLQVRDKRAPDLNDAFNMVFPPVAQRIDLEA